MPLEREVAGIRCFEVLAQLSDYLDGALPEAGCERLEAHVRGCDECARFGGRFSATVTALRENLGPPPALPETVAARLAHHGPLTGEAFEVWLMTEDASGHWSVASTYALATDVG